MHCILENPMADFSYFWRKQAIFQLQKFHFFQAINQVIILDSNNLKLAKAYEKQNGQRKTTFGWNVLCQQLA